MRQAHETRGCACAGINWSWTYEALAAGLLMTADACALQLQGTDTHEQQQQEAAGGSRQLGIWGAVLAAWRLYNAWLHRVISLAGTLNECVSAERSAEMMARGRPDTPTLYDAGKAAFRSQVSIAWQSARPSSVCACGQAPPMLTKHFRQATQKAPCSLLHPRASGRNSALKPKEAM